MKNLLLDSNHLIELPKKTVDLVKLEFSQEEREIYTMVSLTLDIIHIQLLSRV
jgi:hypothetical protein